MKAVEDLDSLLWSFAKTSFIPHCILGSGEIKSTKERTVITEGKKLLDGYEILVYEGTVDLEFTKNYPAAIHFVLKNDTEKTQENRALYKNARDHGLQVHHVTYSPVIEINCVIEKLDLLKAVISWIGKEEIRVFYTDQRASVSCWHFCFESAFGLDNNWLGCNPCY